MITIAGFFAPGGYLNGCVILHDCNRAMLNTGIKGFREYTFYDLGACVCGNIPIGGNFIYQNITNTTTYNMSFKTSVIYDCNNIGYTFG